MATDTNLAQLKLNLLTRAQYNAASPATNELYLVTDDPAPATATHTHGNVTNDGKIGSTADLPIFTTAAGALTAKSISDAQTLLGIGTGGAQIATGSYTGTNTYGSTNPIVITASFEIKEITIVGDINDDLFQAAQYYLAPLPLNVVGTTYKRFIHYIFSDTPSWIATSYIKKSADGKTVYIYDTASAINQWNAAYPYYYVLKG